MIESKDLRIGNYVNDYKGEPYKIKEVSNRMSFHRKWVNGVFLENIYPIELTPEILLKCGFTSYNKRYWNNKKQLNEPVTYYERGQLIDFYFDRFNRMKWVSDRLFKCDYGIQYLHQLQNLFHALCGEELNVEL